MLRLSEYRTAILRAPDPAPSPTPTPTPTPDPNNPIGGVVNPPANAAPWAANPNEAWKVGDKVWYDHLPDGPAKEHYKAKNFRSPVEAAESHLQAHKGFVNQDKALFIPEDNATPEVVNDFYKKLGRPDKPEEYKFVFKDGAKVDETMTQFGKAMAHKVGMSAKQAQAMVDEWQTFADASNVKMAGDYKTANDAAIKTLETKWGAELDANKAAGVRVIKALGLPDTTIAAIDAHIGAAPLIELLAMIGKKSGEGGMITPANSGGGGATIENMSAEQAMGEITRLNADKPFIEAYTNNRAPDHKEAVDRMFALVRKAGNLYKV